MIERDEIVSQKNLVSDQKEEIHKEKSEANVSQIGDETVLGLSKTELTDRNGQRIEGKLLKIVKTEIHKSFANTKMKHTDEILEGNQVENKCLKYWLEVLEQEEESCAEVNDQHTDDVVEMSQEEDEWLESLLKRIAVNEMEMSQVLTETKEILVG